MNIFPVDITFTTKSRVVTAHVIEKPVPIELQPLMHGKTKVISVQFEQVPRDPRLKAVIQACNTQNTAISSAQQMLYNMFHGRFDYLNRTNELKVIEAAKVLSADSRLRTAMRVL